MIHVELSLFLLIFISMTTLDCVFILNLFL